MWLEYHFKDIMCEVEVEGRGEEPNLRQETLRS